MSDVDPLELPSSHPIIQKLTRGQLRKLLLQKNYPGKAFTGQHFNTISHGMAAIYSVVYVYQMIHMFPFPLPDRVHNSLLAFGAALVLGFGSSALYHGLGLAGLSLLCFKVLRLLDHSMVFFLIAGTYTPICLILGTPLSHAVLAVVYATCLAGTVLRLCVQRRSLQWVLNTLYLVSGWTGAVIAHHVAKIVGMAPVMWTAVGGICYSVGVIFFQLNKPNPLPGVFCSHELWHIHVITGAGCHMIAVRLMLIRLFSQ
eukprot:gnl/Dysnectes_brevis/4319_a5748_473.p1 GENE.gnl/Dysnectes_brevis/4319_a5748_473~~gnl/Dysnectes_brevis/4319_a5748_473.p1  ORF type:complete len:257 (-),score=62.11 gnl/Dysnectes_brevis/4319_a5748_473:26-796(-)